jgi:thiamine-monophosphate kinase
MNEFGLIQHYFARQAAEQLSPYATGVVLGIGDDAAILQPPAGQQLVVSTDTLVAGRHFPEQTPAHAIGWKAAAVNLSDIAAMGATPYAVLLALSLPEVDEAWLEQFSAGFFACCAPERVQLIGGDTTRSPLLSITVTVLGWVEAGQAIRRDGAQVGDLVVVSNTLGDAAYALRYAQSGLQARLDYPQPRNTLGKVLRGYANSMLDISDGLAQDLRHILTASGVGAQLMLEQLPLSVPLQQLAATESWQLALTGGDDYELCFSISAEKWVQFNQQYVGQFNLQVIGQIVAEPGLQLLYQQQPFIMNLQGYQHFD